MTLPANELVAHYARQQGKPEQQLDYVVFVDARERRRQAYISTEAAFRASHKRTKWDIFQR